MNTLFEQMSVVTRILGTPVSPVALSAQTTRTEDGRPSLESLTEVMRSHGFGVTLSKRGLEDIPPAAVPVILTMADDRNITIDYIGESHLSGQRVYRVRTLEGKSVEETFENINNNYLGYCWFIKPRAETDRASELPEYTLEQGWFWKVILRYRKYYYQIIAASILVNFLALVTSLYIMNVYDRVVPNKAFTTLWVLSIGVIVAMLFEFAGRMIRGYLTDIAGKKADLVISAALFRRVMMLDLSAKPASSGSYANNLRDFESVRDFMTSASLLAFVDLPFVLLFILIIYVVAGPLAVIPFVVIPVIILIGVLSQPRLAKLTADSMKEGAQRAGLAVEAVEGLETLKANNATNWAQQRWEYYNAASARVSQRLKNLSSFIVNISTTLQQMTTVFLVLYGTYLIHNDDVQARITMGALIAAVILSGRAIAPLAQVAGLLTRYQQTKVAIKGLDEIIKRPIDRDPTRIYISLTSAKGEMQFNHTSYNYPNSEVDTLHDLNIVIRPGEKIGILGRIGSGKSTMLRLAAGMYKPKAGGSITLDGIDLRQIDPADLRNAIHLFSQAPRLFLGTLRQNLDLGRTDKFSSDQELLEALNRFGLAGMIQAHPRGLDMEVGEDGQGLSGGQKQVVALARMTLRDPKVVLLDEPTSGLDQGTETFALKAIRAWADTRTMLIVTHRPQVLEIVDRVIVIDNGRLVMDGPKAKVLEALSKGVNLNAQRQEPKVTTETI